MQMSHRNIKISPVQEYNSNIVRLRSIRDIRAVKTSFDTTNVFSYVIYILRHNIYIYYGVYL